MGLPRLRPVGLVDDPRRQLPDRAKAEGLKVAQRLAGFGGRSFGRGPIACGHVGPNGRRTSRIDARTQPLVDELERGFHAGSARGHTTEDLGYRFDGFDVGGHRQLEPGTGVVSQARRGPCRRSRPPR